MRPIYIATLIATLSLTGGYVGSKLERALNPNDFDSTPKQSVLTAGTTPANITNQKDSANNHTLTISSPIQKQGGLQDKIGFEYNVSKLEAVQIPGTPVGSDRRADFMYIGTEYHFDIYEFIGEYRQSLVIRGYNKSLGNQPDVLVIITDRNQDDVPESISIDDRNNNINVRLSLNESNKNKIESNVPLPHDIATQQYNYFADRYRAFKKENNIDAQIAEYKPRLEVQLTDKDFKITRISAETK